MNAARQRLRVDTQAAHAALDQRVALTHPVSREAYMAYLLGNTPCIAIEAALTEAGIDRLLPDWPLRRRRHSLLLDLAAFDLQPPEPPAIVIPPETGAILGWSYVLEGSRLGARLILQSVALSHDPTIRAATHFLRHGEGLDLWRSFLPALSQIDDNAAAIDQAVSAATKAFQYFLVTFPQP
jgi:heme oxygenase